MITNSEGKIHMRSLVPAVAMFFLTAMPALARDIMQLPEPDTLGLLGIAAAGLLLALRKKRK